MPRIKLQLSDNVKRVVTFDTEATKGATLGTNLLMPNGQIGTPASVLTWLGGALPSGGSSGGGNSGIPVGNYLTTKGDLLTRDTQVQRLGIGATGDVLGVAAGLPAWQAPAALTKSDDTNVTLALTGGPTTALLSAVNIAVNWNGELAATRGGTGHAAYSLGDILYADTDTSLETLGAGPDGWVLTMYGGFPDWAPASGGIASVVGTVNQIDVDDADPANPVLSLAAPVLTSLGLANSALQPGDVGVSDLNDVNLAGLVDGDVLVWDASTSEWVVGSAPSGGVESVTAGTGIAVNNTDPANPIVSLNATVGDLSDVDLSGLMDGDILVWDNSTGQWVAADGSGISASAPELRGASFSSGVGAIVVPTNDVPIYIREDCTITQAVILTRGGTGSCVMDIWKHPYSTYPPTSADSICGSNKPTISSGIKNTSTLVGWNVTLSAGDTLLVNLTSCSTFTFAMLVLVLTPVGSTPFDGYTDQRAEDAVGGILTDTATVDFTYDGTAHTIKADVITTGLSVFDSTHKGVVPASGGSSSQYLSADGTFTTPSGTTAETTGTFTATLKYGTTPSTSQTGTWRWTKIGNMVMLWIPKHTLTQVTDLGSSLVVNGLPTGIRPTNPTAVPCFVLDGSVSGLAIPGLMLIAAVTDNIGPNVDFGKYTSGGPGFTTNFATGLNGYTVGLQMYGTAGEGQAVSYCLN